MEEINWGLIITQALFFWFAYKLGQISIIKRIGKDLTEEITKRGLEIEHDEEGKISIKKKEIVLEIERIGTAYYAYSTEGQFLAQGADFRGLMETIKKQHPGKNFRVEKYQPNLTEEETGKLVKSIFDVFGDRETNDDKRRQQVDRQ